MSQSTKALPHPDVDRWWKQRAEEELVLSAVSVHEIRMGLELMDDGWRRSQLEAWHLKEVLWRFKGRILPVDSSVAEVSGRLLAEVRLAGRAAELGDVLIAATALVHGLQVATLNVKHFAHLGVQLVEF